jgi:hypothetical protein
VAISVSQKAKKIFQKSRPMPPQSLAR